MTRENGEGGYEDPGPLDDAATAEEASDADPNAFWENMKRTDTAEPPDEDDAPGGLGLEPGGTTEGQDSPADTPKKQLEEPKQQPSTDEAATEAQKHEQKTMAAEKPPGLTAAMAGFRPVGRSPGLGPGGSQRQGRPGPGSAPGRVNEPRPDRGPGQEPRGPGKGKDLEK